MNNKYKELKKAIIEAIKEIDNEITDSVRNNRQEDYYGLSNAMMILEDHLGDLIDVYNY